MTATATATRTASSDLHALSIAEASALIARKALSPVELTRALLDRAELLDTKINAYILATPDLALLEARQAEREIMAGNHRGAMHGRNSWTIQRRKPKSGRRRLAGANSRFGKLLPIGCIRGSCCASDGFARARSAPKPGEGPQCVTSGHHSITNLNHARP